MQTAGGHYQVTQLQCICFLLHRVRTAQFKMEATAADVAFGKDKLATQVKHACHPESGQRSWVVESSLEIPTGGLQKCKLPEPDKLQKEASDVLHRQDRWPGEDKRNKGKAHQENAEDNTSPLFIWAEPGLPQEICLLGLVIAAADPNIPVIGEDCQV
jgi:hypothetical protein